MIVDLRVAGRSAVVVGAGAEALKRAEALLAGGCSVHVAGEPIEGRLARLAESGAITAEAVRVDSAAAVIAARSPFIVVAATDDAALNLRVLAEARAAGCLAYAADSPGESDFANLSAIEVGGGPAAAAAPGGGRSGGARVSVAVSTGGASPAMARELRARIEPAVRAAVSAADLEMIGLHARLRPLVACRLAGRPHRERRAALHAISADPALKQLLERGRPDEAWRRAGAMLDAICNEAGPGQR